MDKKFIKSDIKLTIGMLVSNRIQYIRNAMEALKPLLEAIPSELIVVDTKGKDTDGSIDIVREYTDKIYPFEWCDDFSAARNVCLEHAKGEWFLYVDDDEWFDDVTELIQFFQSDECEKYGSGYYYTKDYTMHGGYSMGIAGRVIRRTKNTRFIGKVHETFNEVYPPNKFFSCFTHHYGYKFTSVEDALKHQQRNINILKEELKVKGEATPRFCAQMTQELLLISNTLTAGYKFAMDVIPKLKERGLLLHSCSQWVVVATVRYFVMCYDYEGLLKQLEWVEKNCELTEATKMALAASVIEVFSKEKDYERVLFYAEQYLKLWEWKKENEELVMTQINLDFPKFLEVNYYYKILYAGAVAANRLQKYEQAAQYWKCFPSQEEGFDRVPLFEEMKITVEGMKQDQKQQKIEQVLSFIDLLIEGGRQVKSYFKIGKQLEIQEYLVTMQETAIVIGTTIDKEFGEGLHTVTLLEEYCELVWNCSNASCLEEGLELAEQLYNKSLLIKNSFEIEMIF